MRRLSFVLGFLISGACGPRLLERPLELELLGLSSSVETLSVRLFEPGTVPPCNQVNLSSAAALLVMPNAPGAADWRRSGSFERVLQLEGIETASVQVLAVGLDDADRPRQLGCQVFTHEELERPERSLELQMSGS